MSLRHEQIEHRLRDPTFFVDQVSDYDLPGKVFQPPFGSASIMNQGRVLGDLGHPLGKFFRVICEIVKQTRITFQRRIYFQRVTKQKVKPLINEQHRVQGNLTLSL